MNGPSQDAGIQESPSTALLTEREGAAIRFGDLIDLFTRPRLFFSGRVGFRARRYVLPVVWVVGISAQIDRLDTEILRHDVNPARPTWRIVEPLVSGSWLPFWTFCLILGVISGIVIYWLAGWWYRLRLGWSGAGKVEDKELPRLIYSWSSAVFALPHVLLTIGFTFAYPNYLAAYNSGELLSLILLVLVFWSVAVSYVGATACFSLTPWKARLWFLILPVVFYLFALGLVVGLLAFLT